MLVTKPNRDGEFRCLAGSCPDTCCAGWEIVVDDVSADRFRAMGYNIPDERIIQVGAAIGTHIGVNAIGFVYIAKE